jgi:hypothetical protein
MLDKHDGITSGAGICYPSGAPEFTPGFQWGSCYSIFSFICMFCRFVLLSFFLWPLCCLFFFDILILIAPLVSSNSSCMLLLTHVFPHWCSISRHILNRLLSDYTIAEIDYIYNLTLILGCVLIINDIS